MNMRSLLDGFYRIISSLNDRLGNAVGYVILALTFIIVYEVVARRLFGNPTFWAHESSQLVFGAYAALGGAYTMYYRAHVNIDMLYVRFSARGKAVADIVIFLVFLLYCSVLLWQTSIMAVESVRASETSWSNWAPPIYPFKIIIPIATGLMLLQGTANFLKDFPQRLRMLSHKEAQP